MTMISKKALRQFGSACPKDGQQVSNRLCEGCADFCGMAETAAGVIYCKDTFTL